MRPSLRGYLSPNYQTTGPSHPPSLAFSPCPLPCLFPSSSHASYLVPSSSCAPSLVFSPTSSPLGPVALSHHLPYSLLLSPPLLPKSLPSLLPPPPPSHLSSPNPTAICQHSSLAARLTTIQGVPFRAVPWIQFVLNPFATKNAMVGLITGI